MSDTRSPETVALPLPRTEQDAPTHLLPLRDDDAEHDIAEQAPGGRRPSRARRNISVGAILFLVVAVIAAALVYLNRPITASFEATASAGSVVTSQPVTLTGILRPADPMRTVTLQELQSDGTWVSAGQTTQPDPSGRFSLSVSPSSPGNHTYRVSTGKVDRVKAAVSSPLVVTALQTSTASAQAPQSADVGDPISVTGSVAPAAAGRTVVLERSTDEAAWVSAGVQASTAADGTYTLALPADAAGSWKFRATVAADGTFAAATSPTVAVTVEDVKAAGAHYLAAVEPSNKAVNVLNDVLEDPGSSLGEMTDVSAKYAASIKAFTDALSGYTAWPEDVQPLMEQFIAGTTADYGRWNQLAASDTRAEFDEVYYAMPDSAWLGDLAEQIRQKLKLPARTAT